MRQVGRCLRGNDATCGRGYRSRVCYLLWGCGIGPSVAVIVATPAPADQSNTVHRIRTVLDSLVRQRQALRHSDTDAAALEANRIAIVYWQQELSKRLIETRSARPGSLKQPSRRSGQTAVDAAWRLLGTGHRGE